MLLRFCCPVTHSKCTELGQGWGCGRWVGSHPSPNCYLGIWFTNHNRRYLKVVGGLMRWATLPQCLKCCLLFPFQGLWWGFQILWSRICKNDWKMGKGLYLWFCCILSLFHISEVRCQRVTWIMLRVAAGHVARHSLLIYFLSQCHVSPAKKAKLAPKTLEGSKWVTYHMGKLLYKVILHVLIIMVMVHSVCAYFFNNLAWLQCCIFN